MIEPVSVYLNAILRLEDVKRQLREVGVMISGIGEVLMKDWKLVTLVGHPTIKFPSGFAHPDYPHELDAGRWPDADQLANLLAAAHASLAEAAKVWKTIPVEWRPLLQSPPELPPKTDQAAAA